MSENSKNIANVIKRILSNSYLDVSFDEEEGVYEFSLDIGGRLKSIDCLILVEKKEVLIYGISPLKADCDNAQEMAKMAEYIVWVNYGLKNGGFEMDYNDGEIRYSSYVDCDNLIPSEEVVDNSIHYVASMFKVYAQGMIDVICNGKDPRLAVHDCEERRLRELSERQLELNEQTEYLEKLSKVINEIEWDNVENLFDELYKHWMDEEDSGGDLLEGIEEGFSDDLLEEQKEDSNGDLLEEYEGKLNTHKEMKIRTDLFETEGEEN